MASVDWYVEGISFGNCNCDYGCPCQFESLPTHGHCRGFEVVQIERGHLGDVKLDGLYCAMLYAWPGPVFEGKGEMQVIIDARADTDQRSALDKILHGQETEEGATHWWVFNAMCDTQHETLFRSIECEVDIEARRARIVIPGLLESSGEPIISPATGNEHRVRIDIPGGIEFDIAEIGSASTRTDTAAAITLQLEKSYGQFNRLRHSGTGVVRG